MSEIIRRIRSRENPYAQIPNALLRDKALTWQARGLLSYLLSHADNWTIMVADLINQSPARRDGVKKILKELEDHGYISRKRARGHGGKFVWESTVYESPLDNPEHLKRISEKGLDANPITAKHVDGEIPGLPTLENKPSPEFPSMVAPAMATPSTEERATVKASIKNTEARTTEEKDTESITTDLDTPDSLRSSVVSSATVNGDGKIAAPPQAQQARQSLSALFTKPSGLTEPKTTSVGQSDNDNPKQKKGAEPSKGTKKKTVGSAAPDDPALPSQADYFGGVAIEVYGTYQLSKDKQKTVGQAARKLREAAFPLGELPALAAYIKTLFPYSNGTRITEHLFPREMDAYLAHKRTQANKPKGKDIYAQDEWDW